MRYCQRCFAPPLPFPQFSACLGKLRSIFSKFPRLTRIDYVRPNQGFGWSRVRGDSLLRNFIHTFQAAPGLPWNRFPFPINFRIFADRYRLKQPKSGLILEWNHNDKNCVIKKTLAVASFHEKLSFKHNVRNSDDTSVFITEFTDTLLFFTTSYFREQLLLLTYFYHTILVV